MICLHTVIRFKFSKGLNSSAWPRNWTLTDTITLNQS